jgi:hypothetical protein
MNSNEPPVGPGNPPKEYRWKKGQPSPNPRGRPAKKKLEDMLAPLDKYAEMIDRLGSTIVSGSKGNYEFRENYLRALTEIAFDKKVPVKERRVVLKLLSDMDREALRILDETKERQYNIALDYKERWTSAFRLAEARGKPVPKQLPHPDDMLIVGCRVTIVGPKLPQEQTALEQNLAARALLKEVFETRLADQPSDQRTKDLKALRRSLAKINKMVPPRLVEPVPAMPKLP